MRATAQWTAGWLWLTLGAVSAQPVSKGYRAERIVAASAFHGVHGLAFDRNDELYAGSMSGQSVYKVDTKTGEVTTVVAPPQGNADDLVFLEDGSLVWTSISQGKVHIRRVNGATEVLAENLTSVNSINVRRSDGRLFVSQVFSGQDALWEIDPGGVDPPRQIQRTFDRRVG